MTSVTERSSARLAGGAAGFVARANERGRQAGAAWATDMAEYLDLKRLAAIAVRGGVDDARAGYRVVSTIRGERQLNSDEIAVFRETFGLGDDDADVQSMEFWQGFVQSALEAFEQVEI